MNEFITDLTNAITKLQIEKVINKLNQLFRVANPELQTVVTIIDANRNHLKRKQLVGIISNDEYGIEHNRILDKLLSLIYEIQANVKRYNPFISGKEINEEGDRDIILFLGANPAKFNVDIRKEVEKISDRLSAYNKRDLFEFKVKLDVQPIDIRRSVLELGKEPRFFHYGGNALFNDPDYGTGLVLAGENPDEVKVVKGELLSSIFNHFNDVECVFLNACNTMPYGIEISKNIPYVIAMNQYSTDKFAIDFASYFYEAIGAGQSIEYAFEYGIDLLKLDGHYKKEQIDTPQLLIRGNNYQFEWYNQTYEEWAAIVKPN